MAHTQDTNLYPATHEASDSSDPDLPPMGLRVRLKASFDISGFSPEVRVILQALKTYGMMVADNGSNWYVSGAPDPRWSDDDLHELGRVTGSDFEVVDTRSLQPAALVVSAGGDATLSEGQSFARAGSFTDAGADTGWTATVDYGGGAQPLTLAPDHSFSLAHRYKVAGSYVVKVTVNGDGAGAGATRLRSSCATWRRAWRPSGPAPCAAAPPCAAASPSPTPAPTSGAPWSCGATAPQTRRAVGRSHSFLVGHVYHRDGVFS